MQQRDHPLRVVGFCGSTQAVGFTFRYQNETYQYDYKNKEMEKING